MAVKKRSIALDADVADAVLREAKAEGVSVSAWLSEAARRQLRRTAGLRGVREWEAEHGRISDDEREEARRVLAKHGLLAVAASPSRPRRRRR